MEKDSEINNIIFGNDKQEGIVSIEVKNDEVYLYFNDGTFLTEPMIYWILCNQALDASWSKLKGNNHYKYIKTFDTKKEFNNYTKMFKHKDLYYAYDPVEAIMLLRGYTYYKGLKLEDVTVLSYDIEGAGLARNDESDVYLITNTVTRNGKVQFKEHFRVDDYDNAGDMLEHWCKVVREEYDPDIINGHNIFGYDLDYMRHVASLYNKTLKLGRDNSAAKFSNKPKNYRVDGSQTWEYYDCKIFGREVIDGMFLAVKYDIGRNYPNWKLKDIAEFEGIIKEDRQFYDASKIRQNWSIPEEKEKIVEYGIADSDDSNNLYYLHVPSFFYLCQSLPRGFQKMINSASGSWLNGLFVRSYLQTWDSIPKATPVEQFEGAISYGVPGIYSNCFKQDVASLYPSIMRQWKIADKKKDYKQVMPKVVEYFTLERLKNKQIAAETKDSYYSALEQSQKIVINSMYGFLGAQGLNFNSPENAALITKYGRDILNKALKWATGEEIQYWKSVVEDGVERAHTGKYDLVNCDTDSIMVCKKDQSFFTPQERLDFLKQLNSLYPKLISWEDDGYYDRVVIVKAKNYVLKPEGSDKLKIKGSSFKSASKEKALVEMMKRICQNLIDDTDWLKTVEEYLKEVSKITNIKRWAAKKSISEKLIEANDSTKLRVLEALEGVEYQVGDKFLLFKDVEGERQVIEKGEPKFVRMIKREYEQKGLERLPKSLRCNHKDGLFCTECNPHLFKPKMIPNDIYKRIEKFDGSYQLDHYVSRIYKTLISLENVIDLTKLPKYDTKSGFKEYCQKYLTNNDKSGIV